MKHTLLAAAAILGIATVTAFADDPPRADEPPNANDAQQPPRTHVDTTVVGSTSSADSGVSSEAATLDNDHHFVAGAPDLLKITGKLNLSAQQQAQLNDAVERADAGAAVLIKWEHDVDEMIAKTTPLDPLYAKLTAERATSASRWADNREGLHRDVIALLSPAQRARFEELQASR
jgi:hypothetical protein